LHAKYIFRDIREIRKALFSTNTFFLCIFQHFSKTRVRIFQFSQWNYIETYNYLYLLDSEKSKVYFFSIFCPGKKIRPQNFRQKIRKMIIFKANPRLVKIIIVQKSYWLTIFGPLSVRKWQNLGLYLFLWVWNIALKTASQNSLCVFYESNCIFNLENFPFM
jgi:hypothetical protein